MSALVAQMAQQRAIGLRHGLALALALDRVGLAYRDGDDAVEVPCERVADEVEGERPLADGRAVEREPEAQERVDEALLGALEQAPGIDVPGIRQVRDGAVQGACDAIGGRRTIAYEPIAGALLVVGAVAVAGEGPAAILAIELAVLRPKRRHVEAMGLKAERVAASQAADILEVDRVAARGAFERLHG